MKKILLAVILTVGIIFFTPHKAYADVLFQDDFTDSDNTSLTTHNSIYGCESLTGAPNPDVPVIVNNQLMSIIQRNWLCSINAAANNFDLQIDKTGYVSLYFENQDLLRHNQNTYQLGIDTNYTVILKWVNGQSTVIFYDPNQTNYLSDTYHLELSDNQGNIVVKLNGIEVANVNDTTWQSGYIMLLGDGNQVFDNLNLTYTPSVPSPKVTPTLTGVTSIFDDDFTDSDSTSLNAHNSIYGCETTVGPVPVVLNNQLNSNSPDRWFCSINTAVNNFDLQLDRTGYINFEFENQDLLNHNRNTYQLITDTNYTVIYKWVNGQATQIFSDTNQTNNLVGMYHLELSDNQGNIIAKLNGIEIANVTDTAWHSGYIQLTGTGKDMRWGIETQAFDNLNLTYTPSVPSPKITPTLTGVTTTFDDNFTDSDNTLLTTHNSIYGCESLTGAPTPDIPIIINNQLRANSPYNWLCSINAVVNNFDLQLDKTGYANITFQNQDLLRHNRNSYQLAIDTNYTVIIKWVNGQETTILSDTNQANNLRGMYHLELSDNQGHIVVKLDGVEIANVIDTTWQSGYVMPLGDNTQVYDNLSLTYTSEPAPHNQPVTTTTLAPNADSQSEYPNPVHIVLQANADTGYNIAHTYYTIDNGSQQTYLTPFTVTGAGSHTITYWSIDNNSLEESPHLSQTFTISSNAVDIYLPAGQNQTVTVGNTTLTFSDVTTDGYVVQTTSSNNQGGVLPSEYKLLGTYYYVTTTATYTGTITVTMPYDPAVVKNKNNLKLLHYNGTAWQNITTSFTTTSPYTITGVTSSLSPFAIIEQDTVPPILTDFQLSPYVVQNGNSSTISIKAEDDLTGVDTVTYSLTLSGGQETTGSLNFNSQNGAWQASVYPATGVYAVKITVKDKAGNQSTSDNLYLAVYDPSAGFITGGGWIIPDDSTKIGISSGSKSNFGFVVKYLNGSPSGNLTINYKQDSLEFKSTSLEYLTVTGSTADFQGQAVLNGSGTYTYRVHVLDGSPGQFDIRIWGSGKSFDNPSYRLSNNLSGGNIIIHQ